jgi:hypothetical protein
MILFLQTPCLHLLGDLCFLLRTWHVALAPFVCELDLPHLDDRARLVQLALLVQRERPS